MMLSSQQRLFIDYLAAGQIDVDGNKLTYEEFAKVLGVNRKTLYRWKEEIPGFWDYVAKRSAYFVARYVPKIHQALLVRALKGDVGAAKLLLNQASVLRPLPSSKNIGYLTVTIDEVLNKA